MSKSSSPPGYLRVACSSPLDGLSATGIPSSLPSMRRSALQKVVPFRQSCPRGGRQLATRTLKRVRGGDSDPRFVRFVRVGWLTPPRGECSCCERADLDEVVREDAMSAPGSGAGDAGQLGAVPSVASFQVVDSSFGSGSPFDLVAEGTTVFERAARGAGFIHAGDRHTAHPEGV